MSRPDMNLPLLFFDQLSALFLTRHDKKKYKGFLSERKPARTRLTCETQRRPHGGNVVLACSSCHACSCQRDESWCVIVQCDGDHQALCHVNNNFMYLSRCLRLPYFFHPSCTFPHETRSIQRSIILSRTGCRSTVGGLYGVYSDS